MSEQKEEVVFLNGFMFKRPHEKAPDFVKGSMSIKVDDAIKFLQEHSNNGWVNADLLTSKDNTKLYFKLNTFKPEKKDVSQPSAPEFPIEDIDPNDIPFN